MDVLFLFLIQALLIQLSFIGVAHLYCNSLCSFIVAVGKIYRAI